MANGNGLMRSRMNGGAMPPASGGAPAPGQPMPPQGDAAPQGGGISPEEAKTYEGLLDRVMSIIYDKTVASGVAESLRGPRPVEDLAEIVSNAVSRAVYHGLENGENITPVMGMMAAGQIAGDIGTEMADAAGATPLNEEQVQNVFLRSAELMAADRDERNMTDRAGSAPRQQPDQGGQAAPAGMPPQMGMQ